MSRVQIHGTIKIDGVETQFVFHADHGSWEQWGAGASREELGERVQYLEAMSTGLAEDSDYYNQPEEEEL
jgi:hypothetical protein